MNKLLEDRKSAHIRSSCKLCSSKVSSRKSMASSRLDPLRRSVNESICTSEEIEAPFLVQHERVSNFWLNGRHWIKVGPVCFISSVCANLVMCSLLLSTWKHTSTSSCPSQLLYSPAQVAVEPQVKKFHMGFGKHVSIFQQYPSPAVDDAWTYLYNDFGISRINKSQAMKLPNTTYPFLDDPGYYIAELAVFHQLHCLNILRQSLYPLYYRNIYPDEEFEEDGTLGILHLSHCVESLREALLCASDISVIVWQWNNISRKAQAHAGVVHSCRNFEAIRQWAIDNQAVKALADTIFIQDEVTNPK